ncbi:hypothetical protein IWW36_001119 [Coemansia brasiliensis]|uniref:Uncharacterized protein n=1 Tax=Coemansia brasiliensis TaxID=2650707 RepID=A0A9W8ICE5_9FUNG|nr:hypothetical protein IWW36_001119 [Coemansia brasiliensis]
MIPMYLFIWSSWEPNNTAEENPSLLACTRIQGEVMKTIIFHEHTVQYSPSNRYVASFLKKYIEKIERVPEYQLDDELIEFYVGLAATTNLAFAPTGLCYKTYTLDKEQYTRVVLQEEQTMLSQGATGLVTWEAGLRLADFFIEHPGTKIYDPTIVSTLADAIKAMVVSSQQVVYITTVVRNPETFEQFLEAIDQTETLVKSVMSLNDTRMNLLCHPNPISDIRLVLITHK